MEKGKQVGGGGSSSSSLPADLFGPSRDSSKSSSVFGSVFGPSSTGLGRDTLGSSRKQEMSQKSRGDSNGNKGRDSIYQNETLDPCHFSSSIYYGGQDVYSPNGQSNPSQHIFKKDGGDDDPNGNSLNCASRGNWWQGSLYY